MKAQPVTVTRPDLADFPIVTGRPVTQGHADLCEAKGHARWTVNGRDQGICPRCGAFA
jgi:hypothetical protein